MGQGHLFKHMNGDTFSDAERLLSPGMRISEALNAKRLNALAANARAGAMGTNLRAGPGLRWRYGPQGPTLCRMRKPLQKGVSPLPLDCYIAGTSDASLKLQVRPGTVVSVMPEISVGGSGVRLDAGTPPYLVLPKEGTKHVVLNITTTFSIVDSIFTRPAFISTTVTITLEDDDPGGAGAKSDDGHFYILLATYVDGVRTLQNGHGPITGELCDTLEGSHTAQIILQYPGT